MSIMISVLCRGADRREDVIIAHDGRLSRLIGEPGKEEWHAVKEDAVKSSQLSYYAALGWAGEDMALYQEIVSRSIVRPRSHELTWIGQIKIHAQELAREKYAGLDDPPGAFLMFAGYENGRGKLALLSSASNFEPIVSELEPGGGIFARVQCVNDEITNRAAAILKAALARPIPFGEIPTRMGEVIKETARITPFVNDRIYFRRSSHGFKLEDLGKRKEFLAMLPPEAGK